MRYGSYSVEIPECSPTRLGDGYVGLDHGRQYTILMQNHSAKRCDARVVVDGKKIGTFRVDPYERVVLERAPNDAGRFTFYAAGTAEAVAAAEAEISVPDRGLVQVTFTPEKWPSPRTGNVMRMNMMSEGGPCGQSMSAFPDGGETKTCGGVTGLSGHSDQKFVDVPPLNYDEAGRVMITLRLVLNPEPTQARKLHPVVAGNPVPPPV